MRIALVANLTKKYKSLKIRRKFPPYNFSRMKTDDTGLLSHERGSESNSDRYIISVSVENFQLEIAGSVRKGKKKKKKKESRFDRTMSRGNTKSATTTRTYPLLRSPVPPYVETRSR